MAFLNDEIKKRFVIYSRGKCECCQKELIWDNRDKGIKGAWHAHHVKPLKSGDNDLISNMSILCINEPENCHFNQGHGGKEQEAQPKTKWEFKKNYLSERVEVKS